MPSSITLGSPHPGAPLERGVHRLAVALARLPETRGPAALLALRSVGVNISGGHPGRGRLDRP